MNKKITIDEKNYISLIKSLKTMQFKKLLKANQIDLISAFKADGSLLTLKKYKHFLKDEETLLKIMEYNTYPIMVLTQYNYTISQKLIDAIDTCNYINLNHIPLTYQTKDLQIKSIKMNPNNIWHIKTFDDDMINFVLENYPNYLPIIFQHLPNKVLNKEFQLILLDKFKNKIFTSHYIFSHLYDPIEEWQEEISSGFGLLPSHLNYDYISNFIPKYFKKIINENLNRYDRTIDLAKSPTITSENLDILHDFISNSSFKEKQEILKIIENNPKFNVARLALMHMNNNT